MTKKKRLSSVSLRQCAMGLSMSLLLGGMASCSKYDLDDHDPEGWGASIYSYLEEAGCYTNEVRLINDLGLKEVLSKTGSKTMFVANDDAFARFYNNNEWGVRKYEDLTLSQKRMLLNGSTVNNSYQVNNLSSIEGPVEGQCMRRLSSQTVFDSVSVVNVTDLPNQRPEDWVHNSTWAKFQGRGQITMMRDMSIPPMLHFIEAQMRNNKITNSDYDFLYNYTTKREAGDASVNGVKMLKQNIKCSNGFIHEMEDVVFPLKNMAEIIASKPQASQYNKLLERFCAPFYVGDDITDQYNDQCNLKIDSLFEKRFFSEKSRGGVVLRVDDDLNIAKSLLKFDPEWNTYYSGQAIPSAAVALERDMAVMMVPSNEAMDDYWNNGAGRVLKDQYHSWDKVPNDVIVELINNNMLSSFVESVPSKFNGILNDANDPMGVEESYIDSVWLGCNGAVYLTKKVYSPTSFVSVLYPAIVNSTMKIIKWAVKECQYNVYLNSLNSTYSFFIPTNKALLEYVDPASFGKTTTQLYRFYYDENEADPVWASVWEYNTETGEVGDSIREEHNKGNLRQRLKDILDTHIVIGDVEDGNTYYRTMGGSEIRVDNVKAGKDGMTVQGSWQINDSNKPARVTYVYDQSKAKGGNGKCYVLDSEPILTTRKTVLDVMREHEEMSEMAKLLEGSAMREQVHESRYACVGDNLGVFNTFHYTVYVPTNESIIELQKAGKLPTWENVAQDELMGNMEQKTADSLAIENFLRYHIQDFALYIGATPQAEEGYETSRIAPNGKFDRVYSTLTATDLTVRTSQNANGVTRKVIKKPGLYNLMAREYQLDNVDAKEANNVYTASTAVIHLIDGCLTK